MHFVWIIPSIKWNKFRTLGTIIGIAGLLGMSAFAAKPKPWVQELFSRLKCGQLLAEWSKDSLPLAIQFNAIGFTFNLHGLSHTTKGSHAIYFQNRFLDENSINTLTADQIIEIALWVSQKIEELQVPTQPRPLQGFSSGQLKTRDTENGEAMAFQTLWLQARMATLAETMSVKQLRRLFAYVWDETHTDKPFTDLIDTALERARLWNFDNYLRAATSLVKPLPLAVHLIDRVRTPPKAILLSEVPKIGSLKEGFNQTFEQKERNLVITKNLTAFLVPGMSNTQGTITYRKFPNIRIDVHTHPLDWGPSASDLGTFTSLEAARSIYKIRGPVSFFIRTNRGLFGFVHSSKAWHPELIDRAADAYQAKARVTFRDSNGVMVEKNFPQYTNHDRGECGRFITGSIESGVEELHVNLGTGDFIQFLSWTAIAKRGFLIRPMTDLPLLFNN